MLLRTGTANPWMSVPSLSRCLRETGALAVALFTILFALPSFAQITALGDSYTSNADPTTNYGGDELLRVNGAQQTAYIQFNLGSVPSGAVVSRATLKLFVDSVISAGSFNVDYVSGAWSEQAITSELSPSLGNMIAANVAVTAEDKNQYILIDITPAVQAWLSGSEPNHGIALVANGAFSASFDSKENTATGHAPELDVVFISGGTLRMGNTDLLCVQSPAVSGINGDGLNGAAPMKIGIGCGGSGGGGGGGGSITGVTAGTDLTGGGTSGTVTLNVDTTKVPQLATANTFTGNQTVNGNLSATGVVTGSGFQIGSNLFDYGSYGNGNAFLGFSGNSTTTGLNNTGAGYGSLSLNSTGYSNTANGSYALAVNTAGYSNTASGYFALYANGTGCCNTAMGQQALASNSAGGNTAVGYQALVSNGDAGANTAVGYQALLSNTVGSGNTAMGSQALYSNVGASEVGLYNVAVGEQALYSNIYGTGNTALGTFALDSATGDYFTCVGYECSASDDARSNATAIGAHAVVEQSNSVVLGGTGQWKVNVGIGTTKPSSILTIGRGSGHPISDSWETYSSRRWKTNIKTLPHALAKVEQLRGVSYDLKDTGKHEVGVIAEEVGAVVPEVVTWENDGKDARGVDYGRLTALLIEATKEQQKLIEEQRQDIVRLKSQLRTVQASLKAVARNHSDVRVVNAQGELP